MDCCEVLKRAGSIASGKSRETKGTRKQGAGVVVFLQRADVPLGHREGGCRGVLALGRGGGGAWSSHHSGGPRGQLLLSSLTGPKFVSVERADRSGLKEV